MLSDPSMRLVKSILIATHPSGSVTRGRLEHHLKSGGLNADVADNYCVGVSNSVIAALREAGAMPAHEQEKVGPLYQAASR